MDVQPTFCGISQNLLELARTGQYRWNKRDLAYCIYDRVPGLAADDFADVIGAGFKAWAEVCDLRFSAVIDYRKADFLVLARRIDGKGGVLAEHQLPPGNDMQLRGWLDIGENWNLDMLLGVWTHELGHGMGLSHTNVPKSLMNPFYNPAISTPQAWDVEAVQALYGAAKPANPTPPPVPPPTPGSPKAFSGVFEIPANLPAGIYNATFSKV
jgi:hypothetical protein